jgi:hypothetical protein
VKLGENAALRYWSALAPMQDFAITDEQANELKLILDGTAPYDDLKYRDLVDKNRPAPETMIRGTALPSGDWGLDYQLGPDAPADYVRKRLELGRLNVLYAFHLLLAGDKDGQRERSPLEYVSRAMSPAAAPSSPRWRRNTSLQPTLGRWNLDCVGFSTAQKPLLQKQSSNSVRRHLTGNWL